MPEKKTTVGDTGPTAAGDPARSSVEAEDQVGVQLSLYPLRQTQLRPALQAGVKAAADAGLHLQVGRLSSVGVTDEETAFRALRAAFRAAREHGPAVMVVTLSSRVPGDQSVADIQDAAGG